MLFSAQFRCNKICADMVAKSEVKICHFYIHWCLQVWIYFTANFIAILWKIWTYFTYHLNKVVDNKSVIFLLDIQEKIHHCTLIMYCHLHL